MLQEIEKIVLVGTSYIYITQTSREKLVRPAHLKQITSAEPIINIVQTRFSILKEPQPSKCRILKETRLWGLNRLDTQINKKLDINRFHRSLIRKKITMWLPFCRTIEKKIRMGTYYKHITETSRKKLVRAAKLKQTTSV